MGLNPAPRRVAAFLDLLPFPRLGADLAGAACQDCAWSLTLHQPDSARPERLLGVCERCERWYLVDLMPGRADGFLVGLPDREVVRALWRATPAAGISLMGEEPGPGPIGKPGE
jgi:hypothetical protein